MRQRSIPASGRLSVLPRAGRLLALLALAIQLSVTALLPMQPAGAATADRLLGAPICHSGVAPGGNQAPHRSQDCVVCPLCQAVAQAAAVLGPPLAAMPAPVLRVARADLPPPARAPPPRWLAATAYPRGPPAAV